MWSRDIKSFHYLFMGSVTVGTIIFKCLVLVASPSKVLTLLRKLVFNSLIQIDSAIVVFSLNYSLSNSIIVDMATTLQEKLPKSM